MQPGWRAGHLWQLCSEVPVRGKLGNKLIGIHLTASQHACLRGGISCKQPAGCTPQKDMLWSLVAASWLVAGYWQW